MILEYFDNNDPKTKGTIQAKIRCRFLAVVRYLYFKYDKRVKFNDVQYTIWSTVLGDRVEVDGYYTIATDKYPDGLAIAYILSDTKNLVFYW